MRLRDRIKIGRTNLVPDFVSDGTVDFFGQCISRLESFQQIAPIFQATLGILETEDPSRCLIHDQANVLLGHSREGEHGFPEWSILVPRKRRASNAADLIHVILVLEELVGDLLAHGNYLLRGIGGRGI